MRTVPCVLMRGGTSKGPVFLANLVPTDAQQRVDPGREAAQDVAGDGHGLEGFAFASAQQAREAEGVTVLLSGDGRRGCRSVYASFDICSKGQAGMKGMRLLYVVVRCGFKLHSTSTSCILH